MEEWLWHSGGFFIPLISWIRVGIIMPCMNIHGLRIYEKAGETESQALLHIHTQSKSKYKAIMMISIINMKSTLLSLVWKITIRCNSFHIKSYPVKNVIRNVVFSLLVRVMLTLLTNVNIRSCKPKFQPCSVNLTTISSWTTVKVYQNGWVMMVRWVTKFLHLKPADWPW